MASGLPVVVPKGTLSALRMSRLRSWSCYREHSVEGIMSAVARRFDYPPARPPPLGQPGYGRRSTGVDRFVQSVLDRLDPGRPRLFQFFR